MFATFWLFQYVQSVMEWKTDIRRSIEWSELEALQQNRVAEVLANPQKGFLIAAEPKPTFTHGRFADPSDLLWTKEKLEQKGAKTALVSRGGKWTFHGPGQIMIYPIVHLESLGLNRREIRVFLHRLRESVKKALNDWGIAAKPNEIPYGLYVDRAKLVSFGIHVQKGITSHGLALYFSSQHDFFGGINPCGVANDRVTRLQELMTTLPSWENIAESLFSEIKKGLIR